MIYFSPNPALSDPDAMAYMTAVEIADGQPLESGIRTAINDFVVGCKADGIWDAIKASCILCCARTLSGALVPLKGTAPTNFNFTPADYNRVTGLKGDGATKYLNANRNNNAEPQNDQHVSVYLNTDHSLSTRNYYIDAGGWAGSGDTSVSRLANNNIFAFRSRSSGTFNEAEVNSGSTIPVGLLGVSRSEDSNFNYRINQQTANFAVGSAFSTTPRNSTFIVFARSGPTISNFADARIQFYSIGESINLGLLENRIFNLVNGVQSAISEPNDRNHARIGWQNLTFGRTPTASTSAAGRPAINATFPTTFEFWQPTAVPATWSVDLGSARIVDYVGIVGDFNGATVVVEYSSNNTTWTSVDTRTEVNDRINLFLFFSQVTARYWRLSFSVAIPRLAVAYIGKLLVMQRPIYQGHTPLTLSRETTVSNNVSEGGQYLGRSIIRQGAQTSASWNHLKADWYRANFDPFVKAARTVPFFIGWRPLAFPGELGFCWTNDDIAPENSGPRDFMNVDISFRGLINE